MTTIAILVLWSCAPAGVGGQAEISVKIVTPEEVAAAKSELRASQQALRDSAGRSFSLRDDACYFLNVTGVGVPLDADPEADQSCNQNAIPGLGLRVGPADKGDSLSFSVPAGQKRIDLIAFSKRGLGFADACKNHKIEIRVNNRNLDQNQSVSIVVDGNVVNDDGAFIFARGDANIVLGSNQVELVAHWGGEGTKYGCKTDGGGGGGGDDGIKIRTVYPYYNKAETQGGLPILNYYSNPSFVRFGCANLGNTMRLASTMPGTSALTKPCVAHPDRSSGVAEFAGVATGVGYGAPYLPNLSPTPTVIQWTVEEFAGSTLVAQQKYEVRKVPWSGWEAVRENFVSGNCGANNPCPFVYPITGGSSPVVSFAAAENNGVTVSVSVDSSGRRNSLVNFGLTVPAHGANYVPPSINENHVSLLNLGASHWRHDRTRLVKASAASHYAMSFPGSVPTLLGDFTLPTLTAAGAYTLNAFADPVSSPNPIANSAPTPCFDGTCDPTPRPTPTPFGQSASDRDVAVYTKEASSYLGSLIVNRSGVAPAQGRLGDWRSIPVSDNSVSSVEDLTLSAPFKAGNAAQPPAWIVTSYMQSVNRKLLFNRCPTTATGALLCDAANLGTVSVTLGATDGSEGKMAIIPSAQGPRQLIRAAVHTGLRPTVVIRGFALSDAATPSATPISGDFGQIHWPSDVVSSAFDGSTQVRFLRVLDRGEGRSSDLVMGLSDYRRFNWVLRSPDGGANWYAVYRAYVPNDLLPNLPPETFFPADAIRFDRLSSEGNPYASMALIFLDSGSGAFRFVLQGGQGF